VALATPGLQMAKLNCKSNWQRSPKWPWRFNYILSSHVHFHLHHRLRPWSSC